MLLLLFLTMRLFQMYRLRRLRNCDAGPGCADGVEGGRVVEVDVQAVVPVNDA